jgi:hypothetical protein
VIHLPAQVASQDLKFLSRTDSPVNRFPATPTKSGCGTLRQLAIAQELKPEVRLKKRRHPLLHNFMLPCIGVIASRSINGNSATDGYQQLAIAR